MRNIPIEAVPNQSLSVTINSNRWDLRIKEANGAMVVDVTINDVPMLKASRISIGTGIIPFKYLQSNGNFILLVDNEDLPDFNKFGISQRLIYVDPGEVVNA